MRGLLLWLAVAFLAVVAEQAATGQGMLVGLRIREGVEVEVRNHFKSTDVLVGSDSVRLVEGEQQWKRVSDIPSIPILHRGRMLQNYFRLDAGYRYRREAHAAYLIHKVLNLSQIDSSFLESIDFVVVGREDKLELPQLQVCYVSPGVEGNQLEEELSRCLQIGLKHQESSESSQQFGAYWPMAATSFLICASVWVGVGSVLRKARGQSGV